MRTARGGGEGRAHRRDDAHMSMGDTKNFARLGRAEDEMMSSEERENSLFRGIEACGTGGYQ